MAYSQSSVSVDYDNVTYSAEYVIYENSSTKIVDKIKNMIANLFCKKEAFIVLTKQVGKTPSESPNLSCNNINEDITRIHLFFVNGDGMSVKNNFGSVEHIYFDFDKKSKSFVKKGGWLAVSEDISLNTKSDLKDFEIKSIKKADYFVFKNHILNLLP